MEKFCPICGAFYQEDLTCQSVFDQFLALEFSNPAYGAVHFLTVSCYMIQHGRYSDIALIWIEKQLRDYFETGISADQIRLQAGKEASQEIRDWKVNRQPGEPEQAKIAWTVTILDVALEYQDAESYIKQIEKWARATLDEMQPLIRKTAA